MQDSSVLLLLYSVSKLSSMHFPLFWQGLLEHALSFDAGHPKEIEIVEKKTSQNFAVTDLVIFLGIIFQTH